MTATRSRSTLLARCASACVVLAAFIALGAGATVAAPVRGAEETAGEVRLTQAQLRARLRTTAWLPSWDLERSRASLHDSQRLVGRLSPLWYELRADGRMVARRAGAMDAGVLEIVRERRIALVPTVTNDLDRARVRVMLATATTRRRHVDQLVALAVRSELRGHRRGLRGRGSRRSCALHVVAAGARSAPARAWDAAERRRAADDVGACRRERVECI
jgi:hypothetical protein